MSGPSPASPFVLHRKLLVYVALTLLAVSGYGFLVSGLTLVFGRSLDPTDPLLVGFVVFVIAAALHPILNVLQNQLNHVLDREQRSYDQALQSFGAELPRAAKLDRIAQLVQGAIQQIWPQSQTMVYLPDPLQGDFVARSTDIRFQKDSPLVSLLTTLRQPLWLEGGRAWPPSLESERGRLALLGCSLFLPLQGQNMLLGWIGCSPPRHFREREVRFLETLAEQAGVAVERLQAVSDLERRVREMNVLSRVAQGANFAVSFDDLLELIYAQTQQVIPVADFLILLYDPQTSLLLPAFYIEADERQFEKEQIPLQGGWGLEYEVILTQRPLFADPYELECRQRGFRPLNPDWKVWMGAPLNSGTETIGVISLASRNASLTFTSDQFSLLQAIADQTCAAMVKARLLEESERRAHQLATLNEIGRSLTSTLDPTALLNQILQSAVEILNCTAGSLLLLDAPTGDLVFEVAIGPVAEGLTGTRLTSGSGLAGEAVQTRQPILANDVRRRQQWFEQTDQLTGFQTQDLLVVPLILQERVIGVIEVINKRDGSPFTQDDQALLTTFSSQATVAIENARLYTMTDQALADRVDELSIMQRIDQELNAGLDTEKAMQTTLNWALRRSDAEAGLVGVVEGERIRVVTAEGFPKGTFLKEENGEYLAVSILAVQRAFESAQPQTISFDPSNHASESALAEALTQVVIPIRRETMVTGILLLEDRRSLFLQPDTLDFLVRLTDHAAIAIANSQLYAEVQAANLAKSKFVSFVAHELKNPMASIKGYTELVANGMAGPVNEMQASFLGTVRSNVDRMNTIVSDLNDLTKIQVGSMRLDFQAVQTGEIMEEVLRSLQKQIDEKDLNFVTELPADLPRVWADPLRLGQVLLNLLSNAHKYTPSGGRVTVRAVLEQETVEAESGFVHFSVEDTGIGIPVEDQPKIFQQYFRTDISKETASGTGLGLNITRSLIEMQGGKIWFESVCNVGTTFHFTIPIAQVK